MTSRKDIVSKRPGLWHSQEIYLLGVWHFLVNWQWTWGLAEWVGAMVCWDRWIINTLTWSTGNASLCTFPPEGTAEGAAAGRQHAPAPGRAPLSAEVGEVLTLGFPGPHSAIYPTSKDGLSLNDQPLGQLPMAVAGLGLSGMCLSLSAFQLSSDQQVDNYIL